MTKKRHPFLGLLLTAAVIAGAALLINWNVGRQRPAPPASIPCWETGPGVTFLTTGPAGTLCPDPSSWPGPVPGLPYQVTTAYAGLGLNIPVCTHNARGLHWQVWATDSSGQAQDFCTVLTKKVPNVFPA